MTRLTPLVGLLMICKAANLFSLPGPNACWDITVSAGRKRKLVPAALFGHAFKLLKTQNCLLKKRHVCGNSFRLSGDNA